MLLLNNSVVPRNLNNEHIIDDDVDSEEFIVTQMQYIDLFKESIFVDDLKKSKVMKRSISFPSITLDQSDLKIIKD
jgi:hypothetical protein